MALSYTVLNDVTKPCFLLSAAHSLRPLLLLLCLVFVSGPALAGHLPVAPGSVFTLYDCEVNGCWSTATYSATSLNGNVPTDIVSKAQEWVRYRMQSRAAFLLEYWQRLYDPAYCCNVFIVWTDWTDPTCFPEDTSSPAHNGHAPYGHWVGCETQATGRYYPGWNPPVDYNSGVIHIDLPYDVSAPCPAGTEFAGPNPTDCRPVCPTGTTRDAATGECFTMAAQCPIELVPPYGPPDIYPLDIGNLTLRMKTALLCLLNADATSIATSAYRPPDYNQHLIAVWEKWMNELKGNTNPACQAKRVEAKKHFTDHKLLESQPPVPTSLHVQGEAFDLVSQLPFANLDALANGCLVYRNDPAKDKVHFIHR